MKFENLTQNLKFFEIFLRFNNSIITRIKIITSLFTMIYVIKLDICTLVLFLLITESLITDNCFIYRD